MDANGQSREPGGSSPEDLPPVPLADLERAATIARGVRGGKPGDRRATLEQLLTAFDEPEATPRALRRVETALTRAGVHTTPPLADAVEGFPVQLSLGPVPRGPRQRPLLLVVAALVGLVVLVLLGRAVGGNEQPGVTLPADTTTTVATTTTTTSTPTTTTTTTSTPTVNTTTTPAVELTLTPVEPGTACVVDETGKVLFDGTLATQRTFSGERIRALVGAQTDATSHGKTVHLRAGRTVIAGSTHMKVLVSERRYCESGG